MWAGSGTGRTWQLAPGGGGSLCSRDFTLWVTSGEAVWGDGRAPGAGKLVGTPEKEWKNHGGWQLPLEPEADRCKVGLWGDVWCLDRAWMSEAMEKSCWDSSSAVLYFLFVWSQPGVVHRDSAGVKDSEDGMGGQCPFRPSWQVVKNWLFPEVPQEMQLGAQACSVGQVVTCQQLFQIYLFSCFCYLVGSCCLWFWLVFVFPFCGLEFMSRNKGGNLFRGQLSLCTSQSLSQLKKKKKKGNWPNTFSAAKMISAPRSQRYNPASDHGPSGASGRLQC